MLILFKQVLYVDCDKTEDHVRLSLKFIQTVAVAYLDSKLFSFFYLWITFLTACSGLRILFYRPLGLPFTLHSVGLLIPRAFGSRDLRQFCVFSCYI